MQQNASNIALLEIVAETLKPLLSDLVFVGGAAMELYFSPENEIRIRPTDDIDCIIEVTSRKHFQDLEVKLRRLGLKNSTGKGDSICRWSLQGIKIDIMPTLEEILGFTNRWYCAGIAAAQPCTLPSGTSINILTLPYFVACKLEAFKNRGRGDYQASPDLEDIITLALYYPAFVEDIRKSEPEINKYLVDSFNALIGNEHFLDSVEGHVEPGDLNSQNMKHVLETLRQICGPP